MGLILVTWMSHCNIMVSTVNMLFYYDTVSRYSCVKDIHVP